jgi:dTDP-glucose 4,6-dehydratase
VTSFTPSQVIAADLEGIVERGAGDFEQLRGGRVFLTGGTGFVGSWLLETFAHANRRLGLGARAVVLSRDAGAFAARVPHLAGDPAITFEAGDVRDVHHISGTFDAIVHAATSSALGSELSARETLETIVDGTRSVLELGRRSGSIPFLLTSSGAVYGKQPPALERIDEAYLGGPDQLATAFAYNEAKRLAELSCAIASESGGPRAKIARLFAFVGPYLPLDRHFAVGNFIGDVLAGRPIAVRGDGRAVRTYLYAGDLAAWLWRILVAGEAGRAYNVGGERTYSIADVARAVSEAGGGTSAVEIAGTPSGAAAERYVPSTLRARSELGLAETVPFDDAVRRTLDWERATRATKPST